MIAALNTGFTVFMAWVVYDGVKQDPEPVTDGGKIFTLFVFFLAALNVFNLIFG